MAQPIVIPAASVEKVGRYHALLHTLAEMNPPGSDLILERANFPILTPNDWMTLQNLLTDDINDPEDRTELYQDLLYYFRVLDRFDILPVEADINRTRWDTLFNFYIEITGQDTTMLNTTDFNNEEWRNYMNTQLEEDGLQTQLGEFCEEMPTDVAVVSLIVTAFRDARLGKLALYAWGDLKKVADYVGTGSPQSGGRKKRTKTRKARKSRKGRH